MTVASINTWLLQLSGLFRQLSKPWEKKQFFLNDRKHHCKARWQHYQPRWSNTFQNRAKTEHNTVNRLELDSFSWLAHVPALKEDRQFRQVLTRSMLRRGLALLSIRMICFIWVCVTRLLMQPNTTRARGCKDGLYWKANLHIKHTHTCSSWITYQ